MSNKRNLNGIPGNLASSYLSLLEFYDGGYMADWLNFIARNKNIKTIEIDILNRHISPIEADIYPLKSNLQKFQEILEKELNNNSFNVSFIKKAILKFEIPIDNPKYTSTIFCHPFLEDIDGKIYMPQKPIIGTAFQIDFNPQVFVKNERKNMFIKFKEKLFNSLKSNI